jgi:hypothetical protein
MTTGTALEPVEQRTVEFHGDELIAVLVETGAGHGVYVPIRPLCEAVGVDWSAQRQRLIRDPVLSDVSRSVVVTTTQLDRRSGQRATQKMLCLPAEFLNGWLFGISPDRVRPELRDTVIRYQRECYAVLARAFAPSVATAFSPDDDEAAELVKVREFGLAIARLADEQLRLGARVLAVEGRVHAAGRWARDVTGRLDRIEAQLPAAGLVTEEQAAAISTAVLDLAGLLGAEKGDDASNPYQTVYSALYRRFGVSSYKAVPATRFKDVMAFLDSWRVSLHKGTGD